MLRTASHSYSVFAGFHFLLSVPVIMWSLARAFALLRLPPFAKSQPTAVESADLLRQASNATVREQGIDQLAQIGSVQAITYAHR